MNHEAKDTNVSTTIHKTNGQSTAPVRRGPAALAEFRKKQAVLHDLTLGCIAGNHPGAHVFGPPGVSKTFTINGTLRERGAP